MQSFDNKLLNLISLGDEKKVMSIIRKNRLHRLSNHWGNLLHYAALHNNAAITRYLIKKGVDVDSLNNNLKTPLMIAVEERSAAVVDILLEAKANVDIVSARGKTALQLLFASVIFDQRIFKAFIERFKRDWISIDKVVDKLISAGSSMYHVALLRDFNLMKVFLDRGISIDSRSHHFRDSGMTALHLAVRSNDLELAKWLLNNDANVDAIDEDGHSPLGQATIAADVDMVRLLLEYGANPNIKNSSGFTPLHQVIYLREGASKNDTTTNALDRCVELLLQYGAILHISHVNRCPILDLALFADNPKRMKMLIAHLAILDKKSMSIAGIIMNDKLYKNPEMLPQLQKDFKKCKRSLESKVCGKMSLFDLLTIREKCLIKHLRNDSFMLEIKRIKSKLRDTYPFYYQLLKKRLSKAAGFIKLEDTAIRVLCKLLNRKNSQCCYFARDIISYLRKRDLEQLCRV